MPAPNMGAPADLAARFSSVLSKLDGRTVSADALFEALRLETLDWGFDHGVEAERIETAAPAEAVSEDQA